MIEINYSYRLIVVSAIVISIVNLLLVGFTYSTLKSEIKSFQQIADQSNLIAETLIRKEIMEVTDLWGTRWAVDVQITDSDVVVTVLSANGEELRLGELSNAKEIIEPVAQTAVNRLEWLGGYKLVVQVI